MATVKKNALYVWGKILLRRFAARNGTFEENLGISRSSSKYV
jgi:hypothetical protein